MNEAERSILFVQSNLEETIHHVLQCKWRLVFCSKLHNTCSTWFRKREKDFQNPSIFLWKGADQHNTLVSHWFFKITYLTSHKARNETNNGQCYQGQTSKKHLLNSWGSILCPQGFTIINSCKSNSIHLHENPCCLFLDRFLYPVSSSLRTFTNTHCRTFMQFQYTNVGESFPTNSTLERPLTAMFQTTVCIQTPLCGIIPTAHIARER